MAIPPEPIEEVLPEATLVVVADVTEVVEQPPAQAAHAGHAGQQVVRLKVSRVLRGAANVGDVLTAKKPEAGYALRAGNSGPFLLAARDGTFEILGRYGPDTWDLSRVERALEAR